MDRKFRRANKAAGPAQKKISPFLAQAMHLHQSGQLAQAEASYRAILSQNAKDADATYLLGVLYAQRGAFQPAFSLLQQAVALRPAFPDAWYNLGTLFLQSGQKAEAEAALRKCAQQNAAHAGALWNLANLCLDQSRHEEAESFLRQFLKLQPGHAEALKNLAVAQIALRHFKEAAQTARSILAKGKHPEASALLGQALYMQGDLDEAETPLREAVAALPGQVAPRTFLASLLARVGELNAAEEIFLPLLSDFPDDAVVHLNHATTLSNLGRYEEALAEADLADRLKPGDPGILTSRSLMLVQAGRLQDGWRHYHRRFDSNQNDARRLALPMPQLAGLGELSQHSVLVWHEQGIGDLITYASAIPDLLERAQGVEILTPAKLAPLLSRSFPSARILLDKAESKAARHLPCGELFTLFRPERQSFADQGPYLRPDAPAVARFRTRLDALGPGLKVGIGWKSTNVTRERQKFFLPSLQSYGPILSIPGVTFINFQPKADPAELDLARQNFGCRIEEFSDINLFDDLDSVAALSAALDLVICNGSANAFLAAAVGAPVWLYYLADAHWVLMGGDNIPWLPSMTVVERLWNEGWDNAVLRMTSALRQSSESGHLVLPKTSSPLRN
ncbi:MAG: tetratricopeptide repeat protein [Rhodospirillales bacterium]|jgi:tetratricopeptide (TPR) repeat protein